MLHVSRLGTNIENEIHLPSGDQSISLGDSVSRVSCVTAPSASIQRTKICVPLGSPGAVKAMRSPSGDQRGFAPFTRNRARVPSTFMIQSDVFQLSFILSTQRRP
jgi:hypothetical protein